MHLGQKRSGFDEWPSLWMGLFLNQFYLIFCLFFPHSFPDQVWTDAATQIFFSIGVGFGVHVAYASYNDFHNKIYRDCLIAAGVNSFTSLFSGFVVFAYLGYLSEMENLPMEKVVDESRSSS
ncbi:unnamed protein product [Protopolystoma xenopodis]|uniref:Uncharacterized protein n=1 Tax=Protopolystoma xenopodis TaxID=117903 RepID=A0A3S5AXV4_9PLAT|nr:unnamed protein product [Protopolystoma xenopodis]